MIALEVQFGKKSRSFLRLWESSVGNQEQVLELKLTDAMPDVGTVIGSWGQLLLRGKEWRETGMGITGGVMVWCLYEPEGGGAPQLVEGWIPFQMKWEFPQAQYDGKLVAHPRLRSVDARCVSARKLLLRANVSVLAQAYEPSEIVWYTPGEVPEDVQLKKTRYPIRLAMESGEKQFLLDEELPLPGNCAGGRLVRCCVRPEMIDRKLMGDRLVFRGIGVVDVLLDCGGQMRSARLEAPFSQYAQLDKDYGESAQLEVIPAVTSLESEVLENGSLRVKAGITGQYVIWDTVTPEIVEDAYSLTRETQLQYETLSLPSLLDSTRTVLRAEQTIPAVQAAPVDCWMTAAQPEVMPEGDSAVVTLGGCFTVLTEGETLQGQTVKWEHSLPVAASRDTRLIVTAQPTGAAQYGQTAQGLNMSSDVAVECISVGCSEVSAVTAMELGSQKEKDPARPVLVLQRAEEWGLWQIAKENGSSVKAILEANALESEPMPGTMLLIPVL